MNPRRRASGFTLVELVIVVGIIALAASMIAFLPSQAKRDADVSAAAEELASTLRLARSMAMDRHAIYAVSFNIQNGIGTSGKVLNNWTGGHWYRILGPNESSCAWWDSFSVYPLPNFGGDPNDPSTFGKFVTDIKTCWVGDRHVLPQRKVRFLALGDQDNGANVFPAYGYVFPLTYPRPWFGIYDSTQKRLCPWGGYDPAITYNQPWPADASRSCTGFYYQGSNASPIVGCTNPVDRLSTPNSITILAAGKGRPLINAGWEDYQIAFLPDGSVVEDPIMQGRINSNPWNVTPAPNAYDMSCMNGAASAFSNGNETVWFPEMHMGAGGNGSPTAPITSYFAHTGNWCITLAPDVAKDSDQFDNAQDAFQSIMPAYRVMINRYGNVKVVKVRPYPLTAPTWDVTVSGTGWQNVGTVQTSYQHCWLTNANGLKRGMPVSDWLTPTVLASGNWWMVAP